MLSTRWMVSILSAAVLVLGADVAFGQNYPNKPLRVLSTEAGGTGDIVVRLLAQGPQGLAALLGQPVIVDNRPSGVLPGEIVARATPDGYTLLVIGASFWIAPLLQKMPYDPLRDFSPITLIVTSPSILLVNSSSPVKSVKELIALAKAKPGELNYGFTVPGTPVHIASELLNSMAGISIVRVAYKGTAQLLNAVIAGEIQVLFSPVGPALPHVKSGRLRALAITSAKPSALLPELPTVAASGLPGYEAVNTNGMFAPAKTPAAIINRLYQDSARVINQAEVKEKLLNLGLEPVGSSPEEFTTAIKADVARTGKVIKDAGIRVE